LQWISWRQGPSLQWAGMQTLLLSTYLKNHALFNLLAGVNESDTIVDEAFKVHDACSTALNTSQVCSVQLGGLACLQPVYQVKKKTCSKVRVVVVMVV